MKKQKANPLLKFTLLCTPILLLISFFVLGNKGKIFTMAATQGLNTNHPTPQGPAPSAGLPSTNLKALVAKYLGGTGNDYARSAVFNGFNEVVVGGNFEQPVSEQGRVINYLGTTAASKGRLLRFDKEGNSILVEAVIGERIDDLVYSYNPPMLIASGNFGVVALSPSLDSVLWHDELSEIIDRHGKASAMTRVDVAHNGRTVVMRAGKLVLFNKSGKRIGSGVVKNQFVTDVAINQAGDVVYATSFRNNRRKGVPVQIALFTAHPVMPLGNEFTLDAQWRLFGFNPDSVGADMADTRLYRVTRGADDSIYIAGESAGGNSIFRWDGVTLNNPKLISRGPYHHAYKTKSNHITYYAKVDTVNRKIERGQFVLTRLKSSAGNAVRISNGDLKVDEYGTLYMTGAAAATMKNRNLQQINNETIGTYAGGEPYLLMISNDFQKTYRWTGFVSSSNSNKIDGNMQAVAVQNGLVALFGTVKKGDFYTLNNNDRLDPSDSGSADGYLVITPAYENP
ncbi:MAG: hypothetical protein AB4058_14295 [Microcystaceae cyanobacterium]